MTSYAAHEVSAEGEIDLNQYGPGWFSFEFAVEDDDSDSANDSLKNSESRFDIYVVEATTACCPKTNGGADFYHELNSIQIDFSSDLSVQVSDEQRPDLLLQNATTGDVFEILDKATWEVEYNRAIWDTSSIDLTKGDYSLQINSENLQSNGYPLDGDGDGDGDGIPGGLFASLPIQLTWLGDTDRDLDVDFADFLKLSGNFGKDTDARWADGDTDQDGDVDFADFLNLSSNFGKNAKPDGAQVDAVFAS